MVQGICSHSPKKTEVGQKQSKTSESVVLYCLKKIHLKNNGHCTKLLEQIQTTKELLGVWQLLGIDDNSNCEQILEHSISNLVLILEANNIDSQWGSLTWYQDDESLEGSQLLQLLNSLTC